MSHAPEKLLSMQATQSGQGDIDNEVPLSIEEVNMLYSPTDSLTFDFSPSEFLHTGNTPTNDSQMHVQIQRMQANVPNATNSNANINVNVPNNSDGTINSSSNKDLREAKINTGSNSLFNNSDPDQLHQLLIKSNSDQWKEVNMLTNIGESGKSNDSYSDKQMSVSEKKKKKKKKKKKPSVFSFDGFSSDSHDAKNSDDNNSLNIDNIEDEESFSDKMKKIVADAVANEKKKRDLQGKDEQNNNDVTKGSVSSEWDSYTMHPPPLYPMHKESTAIAKSSSKASKKVKKKIGANATPLDIDDNISMDSFDDFYGRDYGMNDTVDLNVDDIVALEMLSIDSILEMSSDDENKRNELLQYNDNINKFKRSTTEKKSKVKKEKSNNLNTSKKAENIEKTVSKDGNRDSVGSNRKSPPKLDATSKSRASNSLSALAVRFVEYYGNKDTIRYISGEIEECDSENSEDVTDRVDGAAEALNVHVRRIYELIKILEILSLVTFTGGKRGKFSWKGTKNFMMSLGSMQAEAIYKFPEMACKSGLTVSESLEEIETSKTGLHIKAALGEQSGPDTNSSLSTNNTLASGPGSGPMSITPKQKLLPDGSATKKRSKEATPRKITKAKSSDQPDHMLESICRDFIYLFLARMNAVSMSYVVHTLIPIKDDTIEEYNKKYATKVCSLDD